MIPSQQASKQAPRPRSLAILLASFLALSTPFAAPGTAAALDIITDAQMGVSSCDRDHDGTLDAEDCAPDDPDRDCRSGSGPELL